MGIEFEKQIPKEGIQSANAKYMGLADEPRTGTGKKGDWRKAKLKWQLEGKEQENKFILWTPIKTTKSKYKSDEELVQFKEYNIVWVEEAKEYDGKEWVEKKIIIIHDKSDKESVEGTSPAVSSSNKLDVSRFKEFEETYYTAVNANNEAEGTEKIMPNAVHLLGAYVATIEADRVEELRIMCNKSIEDYETKSAPNEENVEEDKGIVEETVE